MQRIGKLIGGDRFSTRSNRSRKIGEQQSFQVTAVYIIERLNVPVKRRGAYFAACKRWPQYVHSALGFAVDHPIIEARDKMFFWKLNDLIRSNKTD